MVISGAESTKVIGVLVIELAERRNSGPRPRFLPRFMRTDNGLQEMLKPALAYMNQIGYVDEVQKRKSQGSQ